MMRSLHRWPGLIAAVLLSFVAITGAILAYFPARDALTTPSTAGMSVAQLVTRIQAQNPALAEIDRAPSGKITAFFNTGSPVPQVIDPTTGASLGPQPASPVLDFVMELHRSMFLSTTGRLITTFAALAMIAMAITGLIMLARRSGGWRRMFKPQQGRGRVHAIIARTAVLGLTISALTAIWMTAVTFNFVPASQPPAFPAHTSGKSGLAPAKIPMLTQIPVAALDQLVMPAQGDPTDVYTLKTSAGQGYVDQGNGHLLAWSKTTVWDWLTRILKNLHTGRGAALMGLIFALSALGVPALSVTGTLQYLRNRRRAGPRSAPARDAEVIVLVASEGGTTWGFAETLRTALTEQGLSVHVGPVSEFAPQNWPKAEVALILAATYGAGEAPTKATGFIDTLRAQRQAPSIPVAVLGFGDRAFPDFCNYATKIAAAAEAIGWEQFLPIATVDRQSEQDFARWGRDLANAIGLNFELHHVPEIPRTRQLTLVSRRDYGEAVQAPTAILRFALPDHALWKRLLGLGWQYRAGDLLGILPQGTALPRYYSLASSRRDGFIEICVRKHPGGLCSTQLLALEPGDTVDAFLRPNRGFHPARGRGPVILIGAGTGLGPLAGFARANAAHRPLHLFFGMRHPESDLLYAEELEDWLNNGNLASIKAAFSRAGRKSYVQDELIRDAARLARLVQSGAQIMVCGGREMASGVRAALEEILLPVGLTPATLKAQGRYAEDIY